VTKLYLLVVLFVAFALPWVEVPERLANYDDPSNDFALITPKPETVCFAIQSATPRVQTARRPTRFVPERLTSTSALPSMTGPELLLFFSIQKK
jgi:hypothetical protein